MGVAGHMVTYSVLPAVREFTEDLKASGKTHEAYSAFLSDSMNYFKNFVREDKELIEGLVVDTDLIQDLIPYFEEKGKMTGEFSDRVYLAPALDESTISSTVQNFQKIRTLVERDIENLQNIMDLLNITTRKHVMTIKKEIEEVRKRFNQKIADLKPTIIEEIQQIKKEYNKEITICTQKAKPQLRRLHQERAKLEKTIGANEAKIERCEAEVKSCRLRKDEEGELRWKKEIKRCRKETSEVEKNIKNLDDKIEAEEAKKKREIANLRVECDKQVDNANEKLRELEASRDGEVSMNQKEKEFLEKSTSTIIDQINSLLTLKKKALDEQNELGLPKTQNENTLIYIPTYFACYRKNSEERYQLYSPSFAGSLGILTKFKGVFGVSRVKSLLKPRSKALTCFLNQLLALMARDPVFKKNMLDAGFKANIFGTTDSRLDIEIGLKHLHEEEWISQNELELVSDFLQEK
jgi:hypothetical protein